MSTTTSNNYPTKLYIYRVTNSIPEEVEIAGLAQRPSYPKLRDLIRSHLGNGYFEHVTILNPFGKIPKGLDMFVDEDGHSKGLPINAKATEFYRANWLKQHPEADPNRLPEIVGTAIIFSRKVWY
jgi:hypothetical protein